MERPIQNIIADHYTVKEAASLLGLSDGTLRVYISNKKIAVQKLGWFIFISKEEIEAFNKRRLIDVDERKWRRVALNMPHQEKLGVKEFRENACIECGRVDGHYGNCASKFRNIAHI